jgi:hypothetical protein
MKNNIGVQTKKVNYDPPKTFHLPSWDGLGDPAKLKIIRSIVETYGRDPRIAILCVQILKENGVEPRHYVDQAACLLKWVQDNIYYVNEPGERLQDPLYTLKVGMGDCDDLAILLCSFFEAIRLPWRLVLSGKGSHGSMVRHIEGEPYKKAAYAHIYCCVGDKPFTPSKWIMCEPTMKVPLGWDIVSAVSGNPEAAKYLPELNLGSTATGIVAGNVSEVVAASDGSTSKNFHRKIAEAVIIGTTTAIITQLLLDYIRGSKWYKKNIGKNRRAA